MKSYELAMTPKKHGSVPCLMPFYSADEHSVLNNRRGPFSAVEILKEVFNEDFRAALEMFIHYYPGDVRAAIGNSQAENLHLIHISEPRVADTYDADPRHLAVELDINAGIRTNVGSATADYITRFRMSYLIDVIGRKCSAPSICAASPTAANHSQRINAYLLPIMYEDDYPETAYRMLKTYYPEALNEPTAIDGIELAHRMRLIVKHVRLPKESDTRGLIFFTRSRVTVLNDDNSCRVMEVLPMTILLNTDLCPTEEIKNSTVVHECVHAYLDYRFFMLQSLSGKPYEASMGRSVSPKRFVQNNSPISWMELVAEKLPAYILMEETNTRHVIEDLYDSFRWDKTPENVMRIVEKLAEKFGVSKAMAKYRMIELGFPEAEGVYCFVGGNRIPDHGCSEEWDAGVTYSISRAEAANLIGTSRQFTTALRSSAYSYVEGHYCLNDSKYINTGFGGYKRLTEYARKHIDECCIAFRVAGRYSRADYSGKYAARKTEVKDKYQSRHAFDSEPKSKERVMQNKRFSADAKLWNTLKRELPDNLWDAVVMIIDAKGISQNEAALRAGVSRASLRKWCMGSATIHHLVAICIALNVRADVGEELIRIAGLTFRNSAEHDLLHAMLFETEDLNIERANEIMRQNGMETLSRGEELEYVGC